MLDNKTYEAFFLPLGVEWGIDWNGEDDISLYTESVLGSPVKHPDIDAALSSKVGNVELPRLLAMIGNRQMNRGMWKRVEAFPGVRAVEGANRRVM